MINFLAASFVGAIWLGIIWAWFRPEPQLRGHVLKIFVLGMIICVPVGFFNTMWMGSVAPHLFDVSKVAGKLVSKRNFIRSALLFLLVAPIEEIVKYLIVRTESYRLKAFDTVEEGVLLAMVSALGFATFENYHYMEQHGFALLYLRGGLCPPGHMLFSAFFGYYLGLAKTGKGRPKLLIVEGLILASLAHGIYNASTGIHIIASVCVVLSYLLYYMIVLRAEKHQPFLQRLFPTWAGAQVVTSADLLKSKDSTLRPHLPTDEDPKSVAEISALLQHFESINASKREKAAKEASKWMDARVFAALEALEHDPVSEVRAQATRSIEPMRLYLKKLYEES